MTLWDPTPASSKDLSSQFYLSPNEFGKSRASASLKELGSVNGNVKVELLDTHRLTDADLAHFHVVVFCNVEDLALVEHVSSYCHAHKIKFILSESRGVFGTVFVDMGEHFVVKDIDGEEREAYTVTSVTASEVAGKTRVTIAEGARIEFQTGSTVVLRELKGAGRGAKGGIEALNETQWTCEVIGSHVVDLPFPRSDYGEYVTGGVIQEVKKPKELSFKSLKDSLLAPGEFAMVDWSKMERPPQSHIAWQALRQFRHQHGHFPAPGRADERQAVVDLAKSINEASTGFKGFFLFSSPLCSTI